MDAKSRFFELDLASADARLCQAEAQLGQLEIVTAQAGEALALIRARALAMGFDLSDEALGNRAPTSEELIPVTEAALRPLGLGPAIVKQAIANKELTPRKGSRQRTMVKRSELDHWQLKRAQERRIARNKPIDELERRIHEGKLTRG
jgi:multidrug resistance efflux pump